MFIRKMQLQSDVSRIADDLNTILEQTDWGVKNQIGLNHRPDAEDIWHDAAGSLYDYDNKNFTGSEYDFNIWNTLPQYLDSQVQHLSQTLGIKFGRARFMRLLPKTGLSVHSDREHRYHLVIKTNPHCYIAEKIIENIPRSDVKTTGVTYHLPADGWWYKVDTTRVHWVYNGGTTERIHLVLCGE